MKYTAQVFTTVEFEAQDEDDAYRILEDEIIPELNLSDLQYEVECLDDDSENDEMKDTDYNE